MKVAVVSNFVDTAIVDASWIKSQMQANFMQIFPFNYHELPLTHKTDKTVLKNIGKGIKLLRLNNSCKKITSHKKALKNYFKFIPHTCIITMFTIIYRVYILMNSKPE